MRPRIFVASTGLANQKTLIGQHDSKNQAAMRKMHPLPARWERVVSHVATQEMLHLALVNNLLSAIGASPYFSRPNFPQKSRYYPPGVRLALLPFGQDALQHFLFLERPEGMELEDAPELEVLATPKPSIPLKLDDDQIVPLDQDFATVGHLYRGIEQGFRYLVEKYGQEQVFVGPRRAQATPEYFGGPNW